VVYCPAQDVRLIVDTTLPDSDISDIIEMSDAEIDRRIEAKTPKTSS